MTYNEKKLILIGPYAPNAIVITHVKHQVRQLII